MNCPGINELQGKRQHTSCNSVGSNTQRGQAPGPDWATTHLYFSASGFDAGMKRLCLSLIVLLILAGATAAI